ncbi:MAG: long-chain fatty acid--CoA ligase [Promethearchaeota archaeon]
MTRRGFDEVWPTGVSKTLNYPSITINQQFENLVKKNPELTYVSLLGIEYSYAEVNDMANRLAAALKKLSVQKGDRIGLFMPNIPQYVIGFLAILKTGAIVVPISPVYGSEDLKFQLKDSGVKVIILLDLLYPQLEEASLKDIELVTKITTSIGDLLSPIKRILAKLLRKIPKSPDIPNATNFFRLIEENEPIEETIEFNPEEDIAVLQYTGGTTGRPKGAMLTHRNIVSNMLQLREWGIIIHPEGDHKRFLGAVPFFHVIGMTAVMLSAAQYESTIFLVPNPREIETILKIIDKHKINYFHGVPTLFRAILDHAKFGSYNLNSLDIIFSGGAPLSAELGQRIESNFGKAIVVEAYGLTETSPAVTANPMEAEKRRFGSIGIPLPDTWINIISLENEEVLPPNEIGEIVINGPQVMKGYYKQKEETELIIKEKYLHTGDIGYMDEEGFFFIVNRKKDMINVSGFKVFPSEVEAIILETIPQIEEVAIVAYPDEYRGEIPKAYVVLKENQTLTESEFLTKIESKVAKYKVPRQVEFRDSLPKTGIGKIDRKILRSEGFSV